MYLSNSKNPFRLVAQIFFVVLPIMAMIYFLLWNANKYFSLLQNQHIEQTIYCSLGLLSGFIFYSFRFRFITTTLLLFSIFLFAYQSINRFADSAGEFDAFFLSIKFLVFTLLFSAGWLLAYGIQRIKHFQYFIAALFMTLSFIVVAKNSDFNPVKMLFYFLPIIAFVFYIIYTIQAFRNKEKIEQINWISFLGRLVLFCFFGFISTLSSYSIMKSEILAKVAEWQGRGKDKGNAVAEKDEKGDLKLKDAMGLGVSNKRSNELIFCAHIDNTFSGTDNPNPLYLTRFHYSKFDSLSETFERDSNMISNDEFLPPLEQLPLFSTTIDSSVLKNAKSNKLRKYVDIEIFNKKLNSNTFLAPSTAFMVQPITVEKSFQNEYKSAYRTRSYVSELNSAYFIYNTDNPIVQNFQEERFAILRKAKALETKDSNFVAYYTQFNAKGKYAYIQKLADSLAAGKTTTIDKVLSVRDYFLAKNELGQQIYKYTDNPGIPGIPSASKLMHFLTESKKGYCAYYSAATLMLLRAMKIPCRISVGFMTVDRSDKNKGWYWYYANQSHAWVEVYFPEYGWLDFDTTVGNDESREAPMADGTPPSPPELAPLAISGYVVGNDTTTKKCDAKLSHITFKDKVLKAKPTLATQILDLTKAKIMLDTLTISFREINIGDTLTAVSYDKKLWSLQGNAVTDVLEKIKSPIAVDEVYVKRARAKENNLVIDKDLQYVETSNTTLWLAFGGLFLCLVLLPSIINFILRKRFENSSSLNRQSNRFKRYLEFNAYQLGFESKGETLKQFAHRTPILQGEPISQFIDLHNQLKFGSGAREQSITDNQVITQAYKHFTTNIKRIPKWKRLLRYLNPFQSIIYFIKHF